MDPGPGARVARPTVSAVDRDALGASLVPRLPPLTACTYVTPTAYNIEKLRVGLGTRLLGTTIDSRRSMEQLPVSTSLFSSATLNEEGAAQGAIRRRQLERHHDRKPLVRPQPHPLIG